MVPQKFKKIREQFQHITAGKHKIWTIAGQWTLHNLHNKTTSKFGEHAELGASVFLQAPQAIWRHVLATPP